jgi:hypothetical protein
VVTYEATASDVCGDVTVECVPPSGSTFPIGTTAVTCTATDDAGNTAECSFTVTVEDTTPPEITCPDDIVAECTGPDGAVVTFEATASDACGDVTVECVPPSGSTFPIGTTTVTCTATDESGNTAECSLDVTVEDTTPPEITCPDDIVEECTGPDGTFITWEATATDVCGDVTVECDADPGTFPCGEFTVTCTATDAAGNTSECSFTITVQDTTPPDINCPEDICVDGSDVPVVVDFETTATDICDLDVDVMCNPPSGSVFNPGTTTVVCAAFDDKGNMSMCHFDVTVKTCVNFDEDVNGMIPDNTFITDQYEILGIQIEGLSDTGNPGVLARTTGLPGSTREDLIPSSGPNYVQTWSGGNDSDSGVITFRFIDPDTMSPQTASFVELTFLDIESSGEGPGGTNRSRLKAYDENGDLLDRVLIPFGTNANQFTASIGAPGGPLRIAKVEAAIGNATDSGGVDELCFTPNGPALTARLMGPPVVYAGEDLVLYRCMRNNTDQIVDADYTLRGTSRRNRPGKRIQGPLATSIGPSYDNFDNPDVLSFRIRGDKPGFWNRNAFIIVEYRDQTTGNLIAESTFMFRLLPPR